MRTKIFITGGTGFIGRYVVRELSTRGYQLLLLSRKPKVATRLFENFRNIRFIRGGLSDIKRWRHQVKQFHPQKAIHLAWENIPDYGFHNSIKNLAQSLGLFQMLAEIGCQSILCAGTCWEYGHKVGRLSETSDPEPIDAFSAAKLSLYLMGEQIAKEHGMQFIWVRPFYVYGPDQKESSLIPYIVNCINEGRVPKIKNPSGANDFVYVEDVARAIVMIAEKHMPNIKTTVYNIGSGRLTSVKKVVNIVNDYYGTKTKLAKNKPIQGVYANISKIKKEIKWNPRVNINTGIHNLIKSYE